MNRNGACKAGVAALGLLLAGAARAQTSHVWDGGGTNNNWSMPANWVGDAAPPNPTTNYVALAGVTRLAVTADAPWTIFGLIISNGAGGFSLGGADLTLTAASPGGTTNIFTHGGSSNVVVHNNLLLPVTLAPTNRRTMMINGAGGATFNGVVTNVGDGLGDLHVRGSGSGVGTLAGRVWLGTNTFFHTDSSTWVVAGTNNVWGLTLLDQSSTVRIAAADALPTNTTVSFSTSVPRVDLNNLSQTIRGATGNGIFRTGTGAGGRLTFSDLGGNFTFGGGIVENGSVVKTGGGELVLTNTTSTYTGTTTVAEGLLTLRGAGTLYNSGAINGTILVSSGTLFFARNDAFGNHASAPNVVVSIPTNGLVVNTNTFNTLRNLRLAGGELRAAGGSVTNFEAWQLKGTVTVNGETTSRITAPGTINNLTRIQLGDNTAGGVTVFDVADGAAAPDLSIDAGLRDGRNAANTTPVASGLTKTGAGSLQLNGVNHFSGNTTLNGGTLALGASGTLSSSAVIRVNAGAVLDVTAPGSQVLGAGQTLLGSGTVLGGVTPGEGSALLAGGDGTPGTLTITGDVVVSTSVYTNTFDLTNNATIGGGVNDLLDITGTYEPLSSVARIRALAPLTSGVYRLVNYTPPKVTSLSGLAGNTYRDTWTLDESTAGQINLLVGAGTNQALVWSPQGSADWDVLTTANWTNPAAGALDVYADNDSVLFDDGGAAQNVVTLVGQVKPASVTVDASSNYTFAGSGRISDGFSARPLTKSGPGTLTLAAANDYSGGTVVSNGTVVLTATNALGGGPVALGAGATLRDEAGNTLTNALSGGGTLAKAGAATMTLGGTNAFSGPIQLLGGTLVVAGPGYLGTVPHTAAITNDGRLVFSGATQTLAGVLSGTGALTLTGAVNSGALALTGTNSFTGQTTVLAGALTLASTNGPALAGPVTADNNLSPDLYTMANHQFGPGTVLTMSNDVGDHVRFELLGTTQTLAGIHTAYANQRGVVQSREFGPAGSYPNAQLILDGSGSYFYNGYLRDSGTIGSNRLGIAKVGSGTQTLRGTVIDYSGPTIVGAGSLVLTNVDDLHTLAITVSNGANLVIDTSARATFQLLKKVSVTGGGTIIQLGTNNSLLGANNQGVTMAMEPGALLDVRGGTMRNEYGQFNDWTNNRASLSVSNGATFQVWDANTFVDALHGGGVVEKGIAGTHTLTVGAAGGGGVFTGVIRNTSGVLNFVKTGAGTQTLGGANSYSGTTTIAAGTLALGAGGSITGTPRILVSTGATFDVSGAGTYLLAGFQSLEGGGTVAGTLSAVTASRIVPGASGAAGTLSFANALNLVAGSTNYFDLTGSTTIGAGINDLVQVGGLLEPSNAVIAVNSLAPLATGSYRLFNYTGTKASSFNPAVPGNSSRKVWTLDETNTPGQINLDVAGAYLNLKWNAQTSTNWDHVGTNWLDLAGATNTTFFDLDSVLFDDSGAATNNIGLPVTVKPAAVTVSSASNYAIAGSGRISGFARLTKDGTGTLMLTAANDYTGGTAVSNGTLQIGNGTLDGAFGSGAYDLSAPGTLRYVVLNANTTRPAWSNVAGAGTLALRSIGVGTAAGDWGPALLGSSFTGTLRIEAGRVYATNLLVAGMGLGGASALEVLQGGQLALWNGGALTQAVAIAGTGYSEANYEAAVRMANAGMQTTLHGPLSLTANATLGVAGNGTGLVAGVVSGSSTARLSIGTASLVGLVVFTNANTYTGGTAFNAGTLAVDMLADAGPSGIGHSGLLSFGGGTLRYAGAADAATFRTITNVNLSRLSIDVTNASASLLLGGTIGGTGGLTKLGAGTLVLSNGAVTSLQANPGLTVRGGTLLLAAAQINSQNPANNADYIGQSGGDVATMTLAGFSSYNRSNSILYIADQANSKGTLNIQDNASFWGNYRVQLGQNAGATGTINHSGGNFTLGNDLYVPNGGMGTYIHSGGAYSNFGGYTYLGVNGGSTGRFYQLGGSVYIANNLVVGHNAGSAAAFYHTNGPVYVGGELDIGNNGAGAYGYYQLSGGSLTNNNWQQAARNGLGVLYLLGGTEHHIATSQGILAGNVGTGVIYVAGSQVTAAGRLALGWSGSSRGEITIASPSTVTVGNTGVQFNQSGATINSLNLLGGVLEASNLYKQVAGGYSAVNFHGGTLRARGSQTILGAGAGGVGALDAAYVFAGGAVLDTTNLTVTVAQPLRAPGGGGVTALPAIGPLPGYLGAPYVAISGGGGTGATAVALFDHTSGTVTGLLITCPGTDYTSAPTVTLQGGGTANNVLGGATLGANASGGLTKLGNGTLHLNSANTYTGDTVVGAGFLFGTGSVSSAVTVLNGAGIGPSYASGLTGTFTVASSLSISNGGTLSVLLRGTNPTLRVTGDFSVAPTCQLQLVVSGSLTTGTHVLVDYSGAFNGSVADFSPVDIPSGSYLTNNLAGTALELVITNVTGIKWDGLVDATWRHAGPLNWKSLQDGSPVAYGALDAVLFDDSAAANYAVDLTEAVSPASVTVDNTTNDYTLAGAGGIHGIGGLVKSGAGSLSIASTNAFTGGTTLNGGTLALAGPAALGAAGQPVVLNGGNLRLAADTPVNPYSLAVRSAATITVDRATAGAGFTNFLAALMITNNTGINVSNGVNVTGGQAGLGVLGRADFLGGGRLDVASGAVLNLAGTANNNPVSSGTLFKNGDGTLIIGGGNNYWDFAAYTFNAGTTLVRNANALGDNGPVIPTTLGTNATLHFGLDGALANKGNVIVNGDAVLLLDRATPGAGLAQNSGTLQFNTNYTLTVASGTLVTNGTNAISFSAASLGGDGTINVVNPAAPVLTSVSITGNLTQTGAGRSLTKNGSGTLTLRPPNPASYSGGTVVNGGTLVLGFGNAASNYGTIAGALLVNSGAVVRSTTDKAFGFANAASGNVTSITLNHALMDHASTGGHGGGQPVYLTASELRSNGGTPSGSSGCFRIAAQSTNPVIYVLASASTSLISGRVAMDMQGKFDVQDGAADVDLFVTATLTDGIGAGNPPNGFIKTNAGTMTLNSSNFYSGVTRVDGGRLLVNNGSGSGTGTNTVQVAEGATLGGTGIVAGAVTSSGTVAPGASVGRFMLLQGYTQGPAGGLAVELAGAAAAGTDYDVLAVGGTVALDGALVVTTNNGFAPAAGNTFTVLTASAVGGAFATTNLPPLADVNLGWNIQYLAGAVVLSVTGAPPPGGYDAFALQITNAADRAYGADPDSDGYANLLEYVTGGNPTNADDAARMRAARTNGLFALRFTRMTNAVDATLYVEGGYASTNNAAWAGLAVNSNGVWSGAATVTEDGGPNPVNVTARDTDPGATNRFLRLRVTRP